VSNPAGGSELLRRVAEYQPGHCEQGNGRPAPAGGDAPTPR
jgi:hypothetical protein